MIKQQIQIISKERKREEFQWLSNDTQGNGENSSLLIHLVHSPLTCYVSTIREQFESCIPSTNSEQVRRIAESRLPLPSQTRWQHLRDLGSDLVHDITEVASEIGEAVSETMDEAFASPLGTVFVQHGRGEGEEEEGPELEKYEDYQKRTHKSPGASRP